MSPARLVLLSVLVSLHFTACGPGGGRPGARALPAEFARAHTDGGRGEVFFSRASGVRSATDQLARAFRGLETYFDHGPTPIQAFRDTNDQEAQASFQASLDGRPVLGVAVSVARDGSGGVGVALANAREAAGVIGGLLPSVQQALGAEGGGTVQRTTPVRWYTAAFPDGSGRIRLPEGWRITSSYQGAVEVRGPAGEGLALGHGYPVATPYAATNPYTGGQMSYGLVAPVLDPVSALQTLVPRLASAIRRVNPEAPSVQVTRILEAAPSSSPTGGSAAFVLWDSLVGGRPYRSLTLVDCSPEAAGWWMFYVSSAAAPSGRFASQLPLMTEAWASGWSVNPEVFRGRLESATRSMRETHRLLTEMSAERRRGFDNALADWSEAFRGTRIVRDQVTGEDRHTDLGWVDETVRTLNERAGWDRFEQIPLRNFN